MPVGMDSPGMNRFEDYGKAPLEEAKKAEPEVVVETPETATAEEAASDVTLGKSAYDMQDATPAETEGVAQKVEIKNDNDVHTGCAAKAVLSDKIEKHEAENGEITDRMKAIDDRINTLNGELEEIEGDLAPINDEIAALNDQKTDTDETDHPQLDQQITVLEGQRDKLSAKVDKNSDEKEKLGNERKELADKLDQGTKNLKDMGKAMDTLNEKIAGADTKLDTDKITSYYKAKIHKNESLDVKKETSPLKGRGKQITGLVKKLLSDTAGDPAMKHLAGKVAPSLIGALLTLLVAAPLLSLIAGPAGFLAAGKMLEHSLKTLNQSLGEVQTEQKRMGLNPLGSFIGRIKNMARDVKADKAAEEIPESDEYADEVGGNESAFDRLKALDVDDAGENELKAVLDAIGEDPTDNKLQDASKLLGQLIDAEDDMPQVREELKALVGSLESGQVKTAAKTDSQAAKLV